MTDTKVISRAGAEYPAGLVRALGPKAPNDLYFIGNIELLRVPGVGFCGSRKASIQGLEVARDCASQAAEMGLSVVSGNAAGVDAEAHYHALASGGTTVLVLPEGIEKFRIRESLKSVWDWDRVLVISQFKPNEVWQAFRAMARNKVIIGLSRAMIVIEAGDRGGTLDAGKSALELDIPLFVAKYGSVSEDARGNEILLGLGALPLSKLRSTMRANMDRVRNAITDPSDFVRSKRLL
jgi:DNA processing protein